LAATSFGCVHIGQSPYESSAANEALAFKHLPIPLPSGITTKVRQGAFGTSSHNERGNEYNWDFEVPFGTPVLAAESGTVIDVWQPEGRGGCDAKFSDAAHNLKVEHSDGTVAQYVHITTELKAGASVRRGQIIAHTEENGWICYPHLHFGVYASRDRLYASPHRQTIPIFFEGIQDGIAREDEQYVVP
jgi:murein DD-endopeptidase MepM/ murein hydrolase activator NlpD